MPKIGGFASLDPSLSKKAGVDFAWGTTFPQNNPNPSPRWNNVGDSVAASALNSAVSSGTEVPKDSSPGEEPNDGGGVVSGKPNPTPCRNAEDGTESRSGSNGEESSSEESSFEESSGGGSKGQQNPPSNSVIEVSKGQQKPPSNSVRVRQTKTIEVPLELLAVWRVYEDNDCRLEASTVERHEQLVFRDRLPKVADHNVMDTDLKKLTEEKSPEMPDGCCIFAAFIITGRDKLEMRKALREALKSQLKLEEGILGGGSVVNQHCRLGCVQKDHYHVSILVDMLTKAPYNCILTPVPCEKHLKKLHDKDGLFLVVGELNFGFRAFKAECRKGKPKTEANCTKVTWESQLFEEKGFGRLSRIRGEHNDKYLHCVVVKNGELHCANLIGEDNESFSANVKEVLPLTKSKDGQYRMKASKPMAYLKTIRKVHQVSKRAIPNLETDSPSSRCAFNVDGNVFSVGMIDLPHDFSEDNYVKTYLKICKSGYRPPNCKSAPMSILGSTVFNTLNKHRVEGVFVPRLNRFSRPGTNGWKMLKLPSLAQVAQRAEQEVINHLKKNDRETLQKALLFRLMAPEDFRVAGTFFNSVTLVGDLSDNHNHRHKDKHDLCSIIITLGKGVTAGSTLYWGGNDIVLHRENFLHGKFQVGPFDKVNHAGEAWNGPRGVLAFYLNKGIQQHFLQHGDRFNGTI